MQTKQERQFRFPLPGSPRRFDEDWHPAEVEAALKMRGHNMSALSRQHGYCRYAAQRTLKTHWAAMQQIIADALGLRPQEIWPSRYYADGTPIDRRTRRYKPNRRKPRRNVYRGRAA